MALFCLSWPFEFWLSRSVNQNLLSHLQCPQSSSALTRWQRETLKFMEGSKMLHPAVGYDGNTLEWVVTWKCNWLNRQEQRYPSINFKPLGRVEYGWCSVLQEVLHVSVLDVFPLGMIAETSLKELCKLWARERLPLAYHRSLAQVRGTGHASNSLIRYLETLAASQCLCRSWYLTMKTHWKIFVVVWMRVPSGFIAETC